MFFKTTYHKINEQIHLSHLTFSIVNIMFFKTYKIT